MVFGQVLTDQKSTIIRKDKENFAKELNFKYIKLPVKLRDIHKIDKKDCIDSNVFSYEKKRKHPIQVSRNTFKRYVDLSLIREDKRHYVLIKDFNTLTDDHTLYRSRYMLLETMLINQYELMKNFVKPFNLYLVEDAVYNFISSMIKESKCCSDVM